MTAAPKVWAVNVARTAKVNSGMTARGWNPPVILHPLLIGLDEAGGGAVVAELQGAPLDLRRQRVHGERVRGARGEGARLGLVCDELRRQRAEEGVDAG